jgi:hypothetical protein
MAVVVLVAAVAVAMVGRSTGPTAPVTSASPKPSPTLAGLAGYLVYTTAVGAHADRLWLWDLAAGRVLEGPRVAKVIQLVNAYRMIPDAWLGVTVQRGDVQRALLMRSWGASSSPNVVATGDRVAWSPGGLNVTAVSIDGEGACGRLSVRTVLPGFNLTQRGTAGEGSVCGTVRSVNWGTSSVYMDLLGGGSSSVFRLEGGVQPVLANSVLVGVSPADALLVEPFSCIGPGAGPTTSTCPGMGVVLPRLGPVSARRVRYPKGPPFLVESVAAWTPDGRTAYAVGTLGQVHGVYAVRVSKGGVPSTPRLVWQSLAPEERVALTDQGQVILARDGIVSLMRANRPVVLQRPGGPPPSGPIVWLRSLPYSP